MCYHQGKQQKEIHMSQEKTNTPAHGLSPLIVRSIVESMPLGVMVINSQGQITVANKVLSEVLGHSQQELLQKGWGQLFIDSDRNIEFNQVFIDVIWKETVELQRTVPYLRPDGEMRTLILTTSYLKTGDDMHGIVLLVQDVTQRERMQERERRMLQAMSQLQTERSEGLNKLALSVAHQIRNPMMTIGGFAGLLRKSSTASEKDVEYLDIIRDEVKKLEGVVTAVVEYASITSADKRSVKVSDVLYMALRRAEEGPQLAKMGEKGPEINIQCPVCSVEGDPEMLARALEELLLNALEARRSDTPRITMRAEKGESMLRISVEDDGEGIKKEFMPYIFDPFFTTRADKVGMGLCLAKRIALEHEGGLTLKSESGRGAVAELALPLE